MPDGARPWSPLRTPSDKPAFGTPQALKRAHSVGAEVILVDSKDLRCGRETEREDE